ncbi:hypothetical protein AAG570_003051 [Ranatra chinensis]|uniref:Uncharacterized protein n=1 Tax=Ranatra chinensis TaxID=642074 RepID=A0ABD0Y6S7_9HEMI
MASRGRNMFSRMGKQEATGRDWLRLQSGSEAFYWDGFPLFARTSGDIAQIRTAIYGRYYYHSTARSGRPQGKSLDRLRHRGHLRAHSICQQHKNPKVVDMVSGWGRNVVKLNGRTRLTYERERYMDTFGLVDTDYPPFAPRMEVVKMVLKGFRYGKKGLITPTNFEMQYKENSRSEVTVFVREFADCDDPGTNEFRVVGNKIRKVNRTTYLYSGVLVLPREINDDYKVLPYRPLSCPVCQDRCIRVQCIPRLCADIRRYTPD